MTDQLQLAYLRVGVPDPEALSSFFGDIIGLIPGEPTVDGALTWRNDDRAQRILVARAEGPALERAPGGDATTIGIEAADDAAFVATLRRLAAAGFPAGEIADVAGTGRRVDRLARVAAPWGVDVELVTGLAAAPTPFASSLVPGGFLTDGVGFGHVVFATAEFDSATRFLLDGLGFVQSDWLEMPIGPEATLVVRFFHCNGRHHTIALARAPVDPPQRLHHLMVEANERDDVGAAFDRAFASGLPLPNGLGRHDNDGMFSFYVAGPAGFQVEVGYGGRIVDEHWENRAYDRISAWGHQRVDRP
ncbi:MAG: VOC family protein [Acidimicrobiales bacterium]